MWKEEKWRKVHFLKEGVAGEETNWELHQQEVNGVQQLKDIKEKHQETKASKVNMEQKPPSPHTQTICGINNNLQANWDWSHPMSFLTGNSHSFPFIPLFWF